MLDWDLIQGVFQSGHWVFEEMHIYNKEEKIRLEIEALV